MERQERQIIHCTQCGTANPGGARFCISCGNQLTQPSNMAVDQAPPIRQPIPQTDHQQIPEPQEARVSPYNEHTGAVDLSSADAFFWDTPERAPWPETRQEREDIHPAESLSRSETHTRQLPYWTEQPTTTPPPEDMHYPSPVSPTMVPGETTSHLSHTSTEGPPSQGQMPPASQHPSMPPASQHPSMPPASQHPSTPPANRGVPHLAGRADTPTGQEIPQANIPPQAQEWSQTSASVTTRHAEHAPYGGLNDPAVGAPVLPHNPESPVPSNSFIPAAQEERGQFSYVRRDDPPQGSTSAIPGVTDLTPPPAAPSQTQSNWAVCATCKTPSDTGAPFCSHCGNELQPPQVNEPYTGKSTGNLHDTDGHQHPISGVMSIGRDPRNTLVLNDAASSRVHCRIDSRSGNVLLSDLTSTNGTWVNGRRIDHEELVDGDRILVGRTEFIYRVDPPSQHPR